MRDDSREYLKRAFQDAHVVELRHNIGNRWRSGTFNNLIDLEHAIRDRQDVGNLYTSLNRPDVRAKNGFHAPALTDADIEVINRVVFDLDPKRPIGQPSTDAELAAALRARDLVVTLLSAHGWPRPALAVSGNGAHAVYRANIKATEVWRSHASAMYMGIRTTLADQLANLSVDFDTSVRNPARIWRLYGTTNRKGAETKERPHRQATIQLPAGAWQTVKAKTVESTARALSPLKEPAPIYTPRYIDGDGDYTTLDVISWFAAHAAYRRPLWDGKHAVLCPWSDQHSTISPPNGSDSVIWEADGGWPRFHCSHAHCDGRTLTDVMAIWGDADHYCSKTYVRKEHGTTNVSNSPR